MWPFRSEFVSQRGGKSSGTIFALVTFYVIFLTLYLYFFPLLALEEEYGQGKKPRLFKSTVAVPDCVTHLVYVCAVVNAVACSRALSMYFGNSDDATVVNILRNPRTHRKIWCVGVLCLLSCLAPFAMYGETYMPPLPQPAAEEDQPWKNFWNYVSATLSSSHMTEKDKPTPAMPAEMQELEGGGGGGEPPAAQEDQQVEEVPLEEEGPPPEEGGQGEEEPIQEEGK